jgi:hypothetical protein
VLIFAIAMIKHVVAFADFSYGLRNRVKELGNCQLVLDGTIVTDAACVKNLGVYLDKSLSMEQHIAAVSKSCSTV